MCWLSNKSYALVTGVIFALIAVFHIWRALSEWPAQIGTWSVPIWVSLVTVVIAGWLAIEAFRLAGK